MNRLSRLLVVAAAVVLSIGGRDACVANVNFPFNASSEGWTWDTIPSQSGTGTPQWEWHKEPSSTDGALRALLFDSGSATGAWAMSPCLELNNSGKKGEVLFNISHYTSFPEQILGQVQFRINTGSGWGSWAGIPGSNWFPPPNHVPPTEALVFPPLLSSSGTYYDPSNTWLAFSGTNISSGTTGSHLASAFALTYGGTGTDLGPGVDIGNEIQFRLVVGVSGTVSGTGSVIWEVNEVQIDGVKICQVPEPAGIVLAGGAAMVGLAMARRSRARSRRRDP